MDKRENSWEQFNKATQEILILVLILIVIIIGKTNYTQYSFLTARCPIHSQSLSRDHGTQNSLFLLNFVKFPKKTELLEKLEVPDHRGFKLTEKTRKKDSCP